jgi:hypothetical protein
VEVVAMESAVILRFGSKNALAVYGKSDGRWTFGREVGRAGLLESAQELLFAIVG